MRLFALGFLIISAIAHGAVVEFKGSSTLQDAGPEALKVLPEGFLQSVKGTVTVEEVALKSDQNFTSEDLCAIDEGVKFGITKKKHISISKKLIELARTNQTNFPCGHGSFRALLKAVLIHELTHIKDNQEKISLDPDFQRIVGMKRVQRNSKKTLMSRNSETSPDAYEFHNLEESLAVNTEYLVLDPEFECRKPATAKFLSKRLGIPLKNECEKNEKVMVQSAFLEDNYQLPVSIAPDRIYEIHYLFAGKGEALMSRWGHAMFRLVVCAPFRRTAGPECLNDVSHHVVISYRAFISEDSVNYRKGAMGGYPSQLFILRYLEVQQEYTKFELRDLYSVPLNMTAEQKRDFLDLTIERYWTYQGKYYFIDNNCGTEAVKHLAVALNDDESDLISSITPSRIYRDIIRKGNELSSVDLSKASRDEMIQNRHLIPSMFDELNESYQFLKRYLPFKEKKLLKYVEKTSARKRYQDYEKLITESASMDPLERKQIALKLVHLERFLGNRYLMNLPKKILSLMNKDPLLKDEVLRMRQSLKFLSTQPWEVIDAKYGAPVVSEFDQQFTEFISNRNAVMKDSLETQMHHLQQILGQKYFEKELSEIEELKRIKTLTSIFILEVNGIN
jgi:hypothetical protein